MRTSTKEGKSIDAPSLLRIGNHCPVTLKPPKERNKIQKTTYLKPEIAATLKSYANKKGLYQGTVMAMALEEYLRKRRVSIISQDAVLAHQAHHFN